VKIDYIAISGIMGNGKTTFARQLSKILFWASISENLSAKRYLPDLLSDPKRRAFETQLSFYIQDGVYS